MNALSLRRLYLFLSLAHAYKFSFTAEPTQCGSLTATWDGGQAPFELLLVPVGHVSPEIRTIVDQHGDRGPMTVPELKFPKGSQFVAVLSDANGVGAGGTSDVLTVGDGSSNCLTGPVQVKWPLFMNNTSPGQCAPTRISWDSSAQGQVSMWGVIPAGQSFDMKPPTSGTGFDWTPGVKEGTKMMIVAGDSQGRGTGGSSNLFSVTSGGGAGCITDNSPGSTAAPAAGQVAAPTSSPTTNASSATVPAQSPITNSASQSSMASSAPSPGKLPKSSSSGNSDSGSADDDSSSDPYPSQQSNGPSDSSRHHVPLSAIVLPILAAVLLLMLALFFFLCVRRRRIRALAESSFDNMRGRGDLLASHPPSVTGSFGVDSVRVYPPHENVPRVYAAEPFVMRPRGGGADVQRVASTASDGYSADVSDTESGRLLAPSPLATPDNEKTAYLTGAGAAFLSANPFADPAPFPSPAPSHSPPSFHSVATRARSPRLNGSAFVPAYTAGTRYPASPGDYGLSTSTLDSFEVPPTYDSWKREHSSEGDHLLAAS